MGQGLLNNTVWNIYNIVANPNSDYSYHDMIDSCGDNYLPPSYFWHPDYDEGGGNQVVIRDDGSREVMQRNYYNPDSPAGTHQQDFD